MAHHDRQTQATHRYQRRTTKNEPLNHRNDFNMLLKTMQDSLVCIALPSRQLICVSASFEKIFGYSHERFMANPNFFRLVVHPDDLERTIHAMQTCYEHGIVELDHRIILPDGQIHWLHRRMWINYDKAGHPIRLNDSATDITARKQQELLQVRLTHVLEIVADDAPLPDILKQLTLAVEEVQPEIKATVLLLDNSTGRLHHGAAPSLPTDFIKGIDGLQIGPAAGSCGTAAYEKRLVIVEDIDTDPLWINYRDLALKNNLHACWSQPILDHEKTVLGTFALYYETIRRPSEAELGLIRLVAHLAGLAIRRRHSEEALQTSEARHRSVVEDQTELICRYDADFRLTFVNPAYSQLLGGDPTTVLGTSFLGKIPPDQREAAVNTIKALTQAQAVSHAEHQARIADGSLRWFEWTDRALFNPQGQFVEYQGVGRDITQRKMIEANLHESEALFQQFMRQLPSNVFILDSDNRLRYCNPQFAALFGRTAEAIIGTTVEEYGSPELAQISRDENQQVLLTPNEALHFEYIEASPRGVSYWQVIKFLIPQTNGNPFIGAISTNITEQKQVEQSLRASEEKYRSLIESADSVITMFDDAGEILYANQIAAYSLGFTPQTILGKNMRDLFPEVLATRQLNGIRQVIQTGIGNVSEIQTVVQGKEYWYRTSIQPVRDESGRIHAGLINSVDITERKKAEDALRASEAKLNALIQFQTNYVLRTDVEGNYTYWNHKFEEDFGWLYQPEGLKGGISLKSTMPYHHERVRTVVEKCFMEPGVVFQVEIDKPSLQEGARTTLWEFICLTDANGLPSEIQCIGIDITEKRRIRAALEEAKASLEKRVIERTAELEQTKNRVEAIFNHSGDGILLLDIHHGIQQANHAFDTLFGVPSDSYLGMKLSTFFEEENAEPIEKIVQEVGTTHQTAHIEARAKGTGDSVVDVEISISPVNRSAKAVNNIVCIIRNITTRLQSERALRDSESRYRLLAENVTDMISRYTPDGNFTFVTPSSLQLLGYDPSELIGRFAYEYLHPDDVPQVLGVYQSVNDLPSIHTVAHRFRRKDGGYVWMETTSHRIRDVKSGEIVETIGVSRDISERKAAELSLRILSQRLDLATKAGNIGVWDWHQYNDKTIWDESMFAIYGTTAEAFNEGRYTWENALHPDDLPRVQAEMDAAVRDDIPFDTEYRIILSDQSIRYIKSKAIILRAADGSPERMVGINMDITEIKNIEQALIASLEKEKELGELKSRFVSMASHEFRTPLTAILATSETLAVYRNRMTEDQIDIRFGRIRHQVMHMKNIMEDVLQLARIQANRVEFNPSFGDLDALCLEIVEEYESQIDYQGRIDYTSTDSPLTAFFDERLMHQVIGNLISNALKYSAQEKSITVSLMLDTEAIVLTVKDVGIGIPPEDLKHLFEPFHRAKNVGTISGTGLGLSIAKQAVELHGCTLTIDSTLGTGTTFILTMPIASMKDEPKDELHD